MEFRFVFLYPTRFFSMSLLERIPLKLPLSNSIYLLFPPTLNSEGPPNYTAAIIWKQLEARNKIGYCETLSWPKGIALTPAAIASSEVRRIS